MARTIIAVFESVYSAKEAVWELRDLGFPRKLIDLIAENSSESLSALAKPEKPRSEIVIDDLHAGANIGAGIGGSLGLTIGIMAGIGALQINYSPLLDSIGERISALLSLTGGAVGSLASLSVPPFLAAFANGPHAGNTWALFTVLLCLLGGSMLGSMVGGLVGFGIPEDEIRQYAKNVREGIVTVMIVADGDAVDGTLKVLSRHNPLEIRQKSIEWHKVGPREKKLAERALRVKVTEQNRPH